MASMCPWFALLRLMLPLMLPLTMSTMMMIGSGGADEANLPCYCYDYYCCCCCCCCCLRRGFGCCQWCRRTLHIGRRLCNVHRAGSRCAQLDRLACTRTGIDRARRASRVSPLLPPPPPPPPPPPTPLPPSSRRPTQRRRKMRKRRMRRWWRRRYCARCSKLSMPSA